jgi:biopolymer transport protein TolR
MLHNRADSLKRICKIDTTAFACVMAVLVFALLIAQAMSNGLPNRGVSINLPKIGHPLLLHGANREGALVITIIRNGKVYFGNDQVMIEKLSDKIRERLGNGERKVYIEADAHVSYGTMMEVLEEVRLAGIERVAFLAESNATLGHYPANYTSLKCPSNLMPHSPQNF